MWRYCSFSGIFVLVTNFITFTCLFALACHFLPDLLTEIPPEKAHSPVDQAFAGRSSTLLIKFKNASPATLKQISELLNEGELTAIFNKTKSQVLKQWYKFEGSRTTLDSVYRNLSGHPAVNTVEYDQNFSVSMTPNDTRFSSQWALNRNTGAGNNSYFADIGIVEAWTKQTGKKDIVVAVLDTGVDYHHEDLKDNMWVNTTEKNGIDHYDDDGNGCVDDIYGCDFRSNVIEKLGYAPGLGGAYYESEKYMRADGMGHGTLVAGVIGAVGNNAKGISGVNWTTRIMAVKFINQNNAANMLDAAVAIQYAVDNGAKLINNSYGKNRIDSTSMQILKDTIKYANDNGVLLIAAAGNNGVDIDSKFKFYPANFNSENLVTVAALDKNNRLWEYSNRGIHSVHLAAPGVDILSTAPKGPKSLFRKYYDPSGYMTTEGTSIAAPMVTGVAALLYSHYPYLTHTQVKSILLRAVDDIPELKNKIATGGKINAAKAMAIASQKY